MKRIRFLFWLDFAIGILFFATIFSLIGCHGADAQSWRLIHEASGALMLAGCLLHLALHWGWIKAVLLHTPKNLTKSVRMNRRIDVWMLGILFLCGLTGVINWIIPGSSPGHFPHNWNGLHHLSGIMLPGFLIIHVVLHWKWIVSSCRRQVSFPRLSQDRGGGLYRSRR